jgi:VWFA-related protein
MNRIPRRRSIALLAAAFLAGGLGGPGVSSQPSGPSPFEILKRVGEAYAALDTYADSGTLRVLPPGRAPMDFAFTTRAGGGGFRFALETAEGQPWRVLWRQGEEGLCWDAGLDQVKPVSLVAELAHGVVEGGQDVLAVPALLLGAAPLEDPDGAALDGPLPCGDGGECWLLHLARMNGAVTSRLWVDRQTGLIHHLEVERYAGLPGAAEGAGGAPTVIEVDLHVSASPVPPPEDTWQPPATARRVSEWEGEPARVETAGIEPEATFGEVISVDLLTVAVRVLDAKEEPIRGLGPEDFEVVAGRGSAKREVAVAAVDWVSSEPSPPPERLSAVEPTEDGGGAGSPADWRPRPAGKRVLIFIQADFNALRIRGQMKLLPRLDEFLDTLNPDDRVAVVSFDSHLKLWQDFTRDREAVHKVVGQAIRFTAPPPPLRTTERGLLAEHFDFRAAKKAATPERALELAARALKPIPGDKMVVYLGWGLGRFGAGGVRMTPEYYPAVAALRAANAPVFVLDISEADYHSLEVGLENVAAATGGTYAKTFRFPDQALRGLSGALAGYYVLSFQAADLPEGTAGLRIRLREGGGVVHVQP